MLVNREDPDVMVKSKDRKTVLFLAAEHNHPKIIEVYNTVQLYTIKLSFRFQLCV